jgi:hypothetical protein
MAAADAQRVQHVHHVVQHKLQNQGLVLSPLLLLLLPLFK